jgi:hypothetical protein
MFYFHVRSRVTLDSKDKAKIAFALFTDLMEENSFDNAIMGCKGVFHIASPVPNHISNDPKV